uniref:Uncharacterized protein n=1 Tax=Rhizophora mucronata TaxID=61149 RepID=A0A2P2JLX1_RHIMU
MDRMPVHKKVFGLILAESPFFWFKSQIMLHASMVQ